MSTGILIAIIGAIGVIVGSVVSEVRHWRKDRATRLRENRQKELLRSKLANSKYEFRKLNTLMDTIGADENTTRRLLIEIGARASTDGQPLWKIAEGSSGDYVVTSSAGKPDSRR